MKVIKNYWKSCLCFLLAFLCILSGFFADINYALFGGGQATGGGTTSYTGVGGARGTNESAFGFRVGIFNIDPENNGYCYLDGTTCVLKTDPTHMEHYIPSAADDAWLYFCPFNRNKNSDGRKPNSDTTIYNSFLDFNGTSNYVNAMTRDHKIGGSDSGKAFLTLVGIDSLSSKGDNDKVDFTKASNYVNTIDTYLRGVQPGSAEEASLVKIFGFDPNEPYIAVLELFDSFKLASFSTQNNYIGRVATNSGYTFGKINKAQTWSLYQTVAPLGADSLNTNGQEGMVIYGNPFGNKGSKALANVAVTYTGEPNTSDANKFESKGTVGGYVDGALKNWNGSGWGSDFSVNMTTTGSNYTLAYTGISKLTADEKTSVNDIINTGNAIGGMDLTWSTYEVNGDIHRGVTSAVSSVGGYKSTQAIADKLSNIKGITNSDFSGAGFSGQTGTDDITNTVKATYTKAANSYSSDNAVTKKGDFKKGETLGLGTEFIVKGSPVTSNHYIISIKGNTANVVVSDTLNYTTNSVGSITTWDDAIALVVAKRTTANTNADAVKKGLNSSMTPQDALNTLVNNLQNVEVQETDASARNVTVGHDTSNNNEGYVIYEVVSSDNYEELDGSTKLEDWFLNKYTNNILETAYKEAHPNDIFHFGLNATHTVYTDPSYYANSDCSTSLLTRVSKDYKTRYSLKKSGIEVDYDVDTLKKCYYPASASETFNGSDSIYKFPVTINTKTYKGARNIDYAFNFIRSATGDVRSISGITYADYDEIGDSSDMLKMRKAFGVVPSTVKNTDVGKGKKAGILSEVFEFSSIFDRTSSEYGMAERKSFVHGGWADYHKYGTPQEVKDNVTGGVIQVPNVCKAMYAENSPSFSFNAGLIFNVTSGYKFTYTLSGTAYKYQTAELAEGTNSLLGDKDAQGVATSANKPTGATKKDTNEYRFATVNRNSNVSLSFYPENYMVCKIGGTVFDTAPYKYVTVMSEVKRKAQSSSLYLVKVNTDSVDDSTITGSTYSDTMQGGTSSLKNNDDSKNKVSIPAGSDVTVLADPTKIKLDLFGYALDIIDSSKDSTMKTGSSSSLSYGSVVKSGANLSDTWGNDNDHADKLKSNFVTWADNVMKVENFGADFTLDVNGNTKGANFGATIGKLNHTSGAVEDGVYNIVVENGAIVESAGAYKNMITQLAADYECSYDEANALFKDSKIYTAILNAIESSTSSFNTSGKTTGVADSWTSTLGNGTNWYDEKVRTFVVRRYTNLGNTLSDITATDKLDYSLAPTGNNSGKENASAGTTYDAKWSLSLFFNPAKKADLDKLIFGDGTYFDPSTNADVTGANDAYTVLLNKTPVKNADFWIPASSTSSFGE